MCGIPSAFLVNKGPFAFRRHFAELASNRVEFPMLLKPDNAHFGALALNNNES